MGNALIVVDVQNDFCEGGSLAVAGGAAVAADISRHLDTGNYDHVVATRDYHIDPKEHFSEQPDFERSWPPHCVAGTAGASFHPELDIAAIDAVFSKGQYSSGYSGFEGTTRDGTGLLEWLRERDIDRVTLAGVATEHCVRATALDAAREGFTTTVLLDLTAGIAQDIVDGALDQLREAGVELRGRPRIAGQTAPR